MPWRNWLWSRLAFAMLMSAPLFSQSINNGAVGGTVLDPDKMVVPRAVIELRNPVVGYSQTVTTDDTGAFRFNNVPASMYEIRVTAPGFAAKREPVEVQSSAPISLTFTLAMAEVTTSIDVGASLALIDTDPSAHTDANSAA